MMFTSLLKTRITSSFIILRCKESFDEQMPEIVKVNAQWSPELSALSYDSNVHTTYKISSSGAVYIRYLELLECLEHYGHVYLVILTIQLMHQ